MEGEDDDTRSMGEYFIVLCIKITICMSMLIHSTRCNASLCIQNIYLSQESLLASP